MNNPEVLAGLIEVEKSPKNERGSAMFSIDEIIALVSPGVVGKCLDGLPFTARTFLNEIPVFKERGMVRANAIGDALGHGHGTGLGLWKKAGRFSPCRDNGALAIRRIPAEELPQLVTDRGFATVEELIDAINELAKFET